MRQLGNFDLIGLHAPSQRTMVHEFAETTSVCKLTEFLICRRVELRRRTRREACFETILKINLSHLLPKNTNCKPQTAFSVDIWHCFTCKDLKTNPCANNLSYRRLRGS